jgi:hypothetical protein
MTIQVRVAFHHVQNHAGRLIDRDFYPLGA